MRYIRGLAILLFGLLLSCTDDENGLDFTPIQCTSSYEQKSFDRHLVGFYPWYRQESLPAQDIKWEHITRLNYSFAIPQADGSVDYSRLTDIDKVIATAHENGVEVYLAIGGGGSDSQFFPSAVATKANRDRLIRSLLNFIGEHCFDGIDIDYEYFTTEGVDTNLLLFIQEIHPYLQAYGYGSSIDVPASQWGGRHFHNEIPNYLDHINIMAYDFTGPWTPNNPGPHSSFEQSIGSGSSMNSTGIAYWQNFRKWPKEKLMLGLPFYGRDFDNQNGAGITFAEILQIDPDAGNKNRVNNIYYNGFEIIESKVKHVRDNGYPGIFIWELAQDSQDPTKSLLIKASETLKQ